MIGKKTRMQHTMHVTYILNIQPQQFESQFVVSVKLKQEVRVF